MYTRITSQMMMTSYKRTLSTTMGDVDRDSQSVTNERKYQKDSEDPTSATRAYQYRREYKRANEYKANSESIKSLLVTRESVLIEVSSMNRTVSKNDLLGAITGTSSPESRAAYAQEMEQTQQACIQSLNTSYGGSFLFAGNSGDTVPFAKESDGTVTFRGIPVDGLNKADLENYRKCLEAGDTTSDTYKDLKAKYDENIDKLNSFVNESKYIDLGFGLEYDKEGNLMPSSAFNTVCNAISFLGFGVDENGNSKNMVQLMGDLSEAITEDTLDDERIMQMSSNLENCTTDLTVAVTQLGSDENFMDVNTNRLENVVLNLTEKINDTEYISMAEAITNFQESQYAYKAALQIGTQILSQSFLDYMK